jgi:adenylate cyclase
MPRHEFGNFILDTDEHRLAQNGAELRLRGKVFDTLCVLVQNAGRLVRKDELLRAVWPDTIVEENNLDHCVSQLRKVFGAENSFIETVPRQGYRFNVEVKTVSAAPSLVRLETASGFEDAPEQEIKFFTTSDGVRLA